MEYHLKAGQYAEDVLAGKIPAGKYTRLACERFLNDLIRACDGWKYRFEPTLANAACQKLETMPHIKGRWARRGELLRLQGWQCFSTCNIFGWVDENDLRRFRQVYLRVPRKNGKSFWIAGVGLIFLTDPDDPSAEVYSGATSEKQAHYVFGAAREVCLRSDDWQNEHGIEVHKKALSIPATAASFQPLVRDPGDGGNPSCAIVDEFHEHDSDDLVETMETGMGAREQPLLAIITTAGSNLGGPCHDKDLEIQRLLEGKIQDDTVFGVIYSADEDDEWDSDIALRKANPNLDVSVSMDWLVGEREKARRRASKQNHFRTKHLNEWVGAKTAWMNMLAWRRQKAKKFRVPKGADCVIAADLASKTDLCAIAILWRSAKGKYYLEGRFWASEDAIDDNPKYRELRTAGALIETPGAATDYDFIEKEIIDQCHGGRVMKFGFDPYQGVHLSQHVDDETSVEVHEIPQRVSTMSEPMKELEKAIVAGNLVHDGSPAMTWCIGNVMARLDEKENIYPTKEKKDSPNKIDGAVAAIMAMGLWLLIDLEGSSYLDSHDLVVM